MFERKFGDVKNPKFLVETETCLLEDNKIILYGQN
jgi:hypothetical protein